MLKLFGSPRKPSKELKQNPVDSLDGTQPYNPYSQITVLSEHTDIIRHLVVIKSDRVATAGDDANIFIWDIEEGRHVHLLSEHSRPITSLYVLPGGATHTAQDDEGWMPEDGATESRPYGGRTLLLSAASDKIICLWEPVSGVLLRRLSDHQSTARCFISMPTGGCFCSGGQRLCLWSAAGDLIKSYDRPNEEGITDMILLRNDRLILAVDKRPVVYNVMDTDGRQDLTFNRNLNSHREAITCLTKINDACFASGSLDGTIILWSTQALAPSRYFNSISDYLGDNRVLPYSIQVIVCLQERYLVCAIGTGFCIYDMISGRLIAQKKHAHYSKILCIAVVHDGTLLATGSEDGAIRFWGCMKTFTQLTPNSEPSTCPIHRLLGISAGDASLLRHKEESVEPQLLGECLGHNGAVRIVVDAGALGILSCGADGLLINWKDDLAEDMKMHQILHDFYVTSS